MGREKLENNITQIFKEADLQFLVTDGNHEKYREYLITKIANEVGGG